MRRWKVPPNIRGPYASRVDGEWKTHRTADAAWRRTWKHRTDEAMLVLRLTEPGYGVAAEEPPERPRGGSTSGPSGVSALPRVIFRCTPEELESYDRRALEAGLSRSDWIRSRLK